MIAPFVDAAWLADHLDDVMVCDVRAYLDGRSGRAAYDGGHVPGAIWVDLATDLSAPPSSAGRHPLPTPEAYASAMAARGIGDDDTVVAYDDEGGVMAARLVWMRRVTGRGAALLDGGIGGWPGPLSTEPVRRPPAEFTARPWPEERLAKDRRGRLHRRRRHRRPRRRSLRRGRQPAFGSARRRTRTYRPGRTPPVAAR